MLQQSLDGYQRYDIDPSVEVRNSPLRAGNRVIALVFIVGHEVPEGQDHADWIVNRCKILIPGFESQDRNTRAPAAIVPYLFFIVGKILSPNVNVHGNQNLKA